MDQAGTQVCRLRSLGNTTAVNRLPASDPRARTCSFWRVHQGITAATSTSPTVVGWNWMAVEPVTVRPTAFAHPNCANRRDQSRFCRLESRCYFTHHGECPWRGMPAPVTGAGSGIGAEQPAEESATRSEE